MKVATSFGRQALLVSVVGFRLKIPVSFIPFLSRALESGFAAAEILVVSSVSAVLF